jgi:hypothetical protein
MTQMPSVMPTSSSLRAGGSWPWPIEIPSTRFLRLRARSRILPVGSEPIERMVIIGDVRARLNVHLGNVERIDEQIVTAERRGNVRVDGQQRAVHADGAHESIFSNWSSRSL